MKYAIGFLLGAAVGALVALLFAPSAGEELRANIKSQADTQYARLQDKWQEGMQEMQTRMDRMTNDERAMLSQSEETAQPA